MIRERRRKARTKVAEICYIQIEPDNGGVVLDLSEDGLSFQAAGPVQEAAQVRFSFLSYGRGRVEATGELVWKTQDRKSGGLRFTELTAAAQGCVRELLGTVPEVSNAVEAVDEATVVTPIAAPVPEPIVSDASIKAPIVQSTRIEPASEVTAAESKLPVAIPSPERAPEPIMQLGSSYRQRESSFGATSVLFGSQRAEPAPSDEWNAARRSGFLRGLLTGVIVTALAAGLWNFRDQVRQFVATEIGTSQAQSSAENQVSPAPPPPPANALSQTPVAGPIDPYSAAPPPVSAPPAAPTPAVPAAPPANQDPQQRATPPVPTAQAPSPTVPTETDSAHTAPREPTRAEQPLQKDEALEFGTPEQRLWAAVRDGNTDAEVELSDLYLRGDGVKKNCEQARILLLAAARKGSAVAREKLQAANSCRG